MPPQSDPQRDGIYYIEGEFAGAWKYCRTSRADLIGLLACVGRYYRLDPPRLKIVQRIPGGHAGQYGEDEIELARTGEGTNPMVLLHECAHWLVDELYEGKEVEDHGPEFAAILMHLYDKFSIIPNECFRMLAKKNKVRMARRYRPVAFR